MTLKQFILQNPLLSAGITLCLIGIIYFLFNTLYAAGNIAVLNHANKDLEKQVSAIQKQRDDIAVEIAQRDLIIQQKEKELTEINALLQTISAKVVTDRKALDDATATASKLLLDDSPLSRDELRNKLCGLYNIPPSACK